MVAVIFRVMFGVVVILEGLVRSDPQRASAGHQPDGQYDDYDQISNSPTHANTLPSITYLVKQLDPRLANRSRESMNGTQLRAAQTIATLRPKPPTGRLVPGSCDGLAGAANTVRRKFFSRRSAM